MPTWTSSVTTKSILAGPVYVAWASEVVTGGVMSPEP
jgi:hypothetical protein